MSKDKKKSRSSANAVILEQIAIKYNITPQYARECVKGHSGSEIVPLIQSDYKLAERKLNNLL